MLLLGGVEIRGFLGETMRRAKAAFGGRLGNFGRFRPPTTDGFNVSDQFARASLSQDRKINIERSAQFGIGLGLHCSEKARITLLS